VTLAISSKEREITIKLDESPPKKSSGKEPTVEEMKAVTRSAVKDFKEIDLPKLEEEYPPITGDTLMSVVNE